MTTPRRSIAAVAIILIASVIAPLTPAAATPPSNDDIRAATHVASVPFRVEQDTSEATRAIDDPATAGRDCFGNETHTVWYRFTAPDSETYVLDTAGSSYDTTLAVYTGTPATLSVLDCNAYFNGNSQGRLLLAAEAGITYYVLVAATQGSHVPGGSLVFTVDVSPVDPLQVDLAIDPGAALLGNGEVELRGQVSCSRPAEVGLDGALSQADSHSFFFPEPFACGLKPTPFRAPTRERNGEGLRSGPATALIVAYGYDRYDRDVPEVTAEVEVGPGPMVFARSVAGFDDPGHTEIFVMDGDGNRVRRLTNNETEDSFPAISPDGQRIAFARSTGGQFDLFVMDVEGKNLERLTVTKHDEVLPTWSPSGFKLAYTATFDTVDGWQSDIYKMRLWDGRVRRITDTPVTKEFAPEWSPDGKLIAFTKQEQRTHRYGIATIRPNGQDLSWLVINPRSGEGYTDVNPTWSPDSQWVAFSRDHGDDPYVDIYKVRRDGSDVQAVTQLFELAENPAWGADGRIALQHDEGIAIVAGDRGLIQHITPTRTAVPYQWPDW